MAVQLLLLGWAVVVVGSYVSAAHPFPIGIYGVSSTNDFQVIKAAGFGLVNGPVTKAYLDAASANGLQVVGSPWPLTGRGFDRRAARRVVRQFDRHPAMRAWSLADEPDMHGTSPDELKDLNRWIKRVGARKPTALVLHQGASALHYGGITDILMVDRYPIPWLPLANFPQNVRLARLGAGLDRPLFAVIQAFDWTSYPELLPGHEGLRPPTYVELRCMTYCALLRQADGIFYYCFDDGRWSMRDNPDVWRDLALVVGEIRKWEPLFTAERPWWPYKHDFGHRASAFNAALEASVSPVLLRVRTGNAEIESGDYVLAVNTTPNVHTYRLKLTGYADGEVRVLGEQRVIQAAKGWMEDGFGPYAIHIYGPLRERVRGGGVVGGSTAKEREWQEEGGRGQVR